MQIISRINNANTFDIVQLMLSEDPMFLSQGNILARNYGGSAENAGFEIWKLLRNLKYKADTGHQYIKSPYRLLKSGSGDCKSYSVYAAAVLRSLGYAVNYIFTNVDNSDKPTHVYLRYSVPGSEDWLYLDGTIDEFNAEAFAVKHWYIEL